MHILHNSKPPVALAQLGLRCYRPNMKTTSTAARLLRWGALLLLVASLGTWFATGANRGWTRTEDTVMEKDEITGLEYPVSKPVFQPGVDVLLPVLAVAGMAFATSLFLSRRSKALA